MKLGKLYNEAAEAAALEDMDSSVLKAGMRVLARVEYVGQPKPFRKGTPGETVSVKMEVTEGDLKGGQFWDSLMFSPVAQRWARQMNEASFLKMAAAGVSQSVFETDFETEGINGLINGNLVYVNVAYQSNGYRQFTWDSPDGAAPAAAAGDDEELMF